MVLSPMSWKLVRASGAELIEVEACQVLSVVAPIFSVCLIAGSSRRLFTSAGHAAQEGNVFILNADLECFGEDSAHMCIIRAVGLKGKGRRLSASLGADLSFLLALKDVASRKVGLGDVVALGPRVAGMR